MGATVKMSTSAWNIVEFVQETFTVQTPLEATFVVVVTDIELLAVNVLILTNASQ